MPPPAESLQEQRRHWMAVLARAEFAEIETACVGLDALPAFQWLRAPETGLVMVQGRAGGSGVRFNMGEASVTRCALRVASGTTGFAYVLGRDPRHAELAALLDALMQDPGSGTAVKRSVIEPLARAQAERRAIAACKAAATKVDFLTLARGEDGQ